MEYKSEAELLAFVPKPGNTWQEAGFVSLDEMRAWSRLKTAQWENNRIPKGNPVDN